MRRVRSCAARPKGGHYKGEGGGRMKARVGFATLSAVRGVSFTPLTGELAKPRQTVLAALWVRLR
jgi:hypothetical protein